MMLRSTAGRTSGAGGEAGRKAGANLTRQSYQAAMQSLGAWNFPYTGPGSLRAGKLGIADSVRTKEYRNNCRCWIPIDEFVPAPP